MRYLKRSILDSAHLLRVPEWISPADWAERYRKLPSGSAEPGPFRMDRSPWVRPILDRCASGQHNKVVVVCGSQLSKTDGILVNLLGWRLDINPAPVIYYAPTAALAKTASKFRIDPMLRSTPALYDGLRKGSADTLYEKEVNGQRVGISSTSASAQLRMHNAPLVLIDERDASKQIGPEGDIVDVANARMATYADKLMVVASSPLKGNVLSAIDEVSGIEHWQPDTEDSIESPVWRLWQQGTRHEWSIPCPHCNDYFTPRSRLLVWGNHVSPSKAAEHAVVQCPRCEGAIHHEEIADLNLRGVAVCPGQQIADGEVIGEEPDNLIYSIWISGLCSPWVTWRERAYALAKARIDERRVEGALQGVLNTDFGELYSADREGLKEGEVKGCIGDYLMGEVDDRITAVSMGVDVGGDRFLYVVRGWAHDYTSWMLDYGDLFGDTDNPRVWRELGEYILDSDFAGMKIRKVGVDAGYLPNNTYGFARQHRGLVHPLMGSSNQRKIYAPKLVDVNLRGKVIRGGATLGSFNSNIAKDFVHTRIMFDSSEPGAFFVPRDVPPKYFREITAEVKYRKPSGGFGFKELRRANHSLDAEAMAYIMAYTMRIGRKRRTQDSAYDEIGDQRHDRKGDQSKSEPQQPGADWGVGLGGSW